MLDFYKVNEQIAIAPQFGLSDIEDIAKQGFQKIICNRPDKEDASQPDFIEIQQKAKELGIESLFAPMDQSGISEQSLAEIYSAIKLGQKILMYCRSGQRCAYALVYMLAMHKEDYQEMLLALQNAGFQITAT